MERLGTVCAVLVAACALVVTWWVTAHLAVEDVRSATERAPAAEDARPADAPDEGGATAEMARTGGVDAGRARAASWWVLVGIGVPMVLGIVVVARPRDRALRSRSEREQAVRDREARVTAAEQHLERVRTELLTAVSHEVRTPLQVIEGTASLLVSRGEDMRPEQLATLADGLVTNSRRLSGLLVDLLDLEQLVQGRMAPHREVVVAGDVVDAVLARHDVGERDVTVVGRDVPVHADPAQLERVLDHLLHNALRHTPPGSPVTIRATREDDTTDLVVADTGPGIPADLRLRVFDPLFRVPDGRPDPGLGVGLALVRRFVDRHGGQVWIDDAPGGGAAVHVRIPDDGQPEGVDAWGVAAALAG